MKYACLIYVPENGVQPSEAEMQGILGEYMALSQQAVASGIMTGGERLADSGSATTVRLRDGKRLTTDGPFAETKEVLGGFMLIDVPSLDEALDFAAKIPGARQGSVEVRPILERGA